MNFALRTNDDVFVYDLLKLTVNRPGVGHYAGGLMPIVEAGSVRLAASFVAKVLANRLDFLRIAAVFHGQTHSRMAEGMGMIVL